MLYKIPLSYNPIDIPKLTEVLSRYEGKHHNEMIADFEEMFKKMIGAPHIAAVNSGTSAIHLALKVLGVGPGDIVIVPTFTYVATVNPVHYIGATPFFIDSENETWNIDAELLEEGIKKLLEQKRKPKAIIVIHTYGMPANMNRIIKIARDYEIPVVEDAAESLGSECEGKKIGLLGDIGIFSFNNNKVFTTYGGGAIVSRSQEYIKMAKLLSAQAREDLPYYEHRMVGYNYAISPLAAAYGMTQLPLMSKNIANRRHLFDVYRTSFSGLDVHFQVEQKGSSSNRWFSTILFKDEATRKMVSTVLHQAGAETRPLWNPIHQQPVYQHLTGVMSGTAIQFFKKGLCLPSSSGMTSDQQQYVVDLVKKSLLL